MSKDRRQDIHADALSARINGFPELVRQNASKVFLGITLVLLVIVLIRYRNQSAEQRANTAQYALAKAHLDLNQLQTFLQAPSQKPEMLASARSQLSSQCQSDVGDVLGNTEESDTALRAEAYCVRADMYWALANSLSTGSTTAPASSMPTAESPESYLSKAEADYRHILETFKDNDTARARSYLGLAAIAENRHNWDDARKQYEALKQSDLSDFWKKLAITRLSLLDSIEKPVQIGPIPGQAEPSEPMVFVKTTQPTTAAATSAPATLP